MLSEVLVASKCGPRETDYVIKTGHTEKFL